MTMTLPTPPTVRTRLLKSESPTERVYDVDLSDKTCAVEYEFLNPKNGAVIGGVRLLADGTRQPIADELPIATPYSIGDAFQTAKQWPWWAHALWSAGLLEFLNLIARTHG